jgi:hypothetical protein
LAARALENVHSGRNKLFLINDLSLYSLVA